MSFVGESVTNGHFMRRLFRDVWYSLQSREIINILLGSCLFCF